MSTRRRSSLIPTRATRRLSTRLVAAERALQAHRRVIDALHHIAALALREQPLPAVLQEIVEEVSAATGFPIVAIEFYDPVGQCMEFAATTGIPSLPGHDPLRVPVDQTLSGLVAQRGQVLVEAHAQGRPEYVAAALRQLGVQTFVCLPLIVSDQVLGTLALAHPDTVSLDDDLIPLAQSLTHVIATLIARRRAEAESQVALTKYHTLFESFPLGITVSDATGQIVEANQMAERLLGMGAEEQRQCAIDGAEWQIVCPDSSPMPAEEYRRKDGSIVPIELRAVLLHDDHGQPTGPWGIIRDITERRHAEALVATQRDLAHLIATTTDPAVAWPRCLALAMQVCELDCGGLYLFDADAQALELVAHQGLSEGFVQAAARYPLDAPNAQLLLAGKAVYWSAADLQQRDVFRHETLTCAVVMPIHAQGRILGCVNLGSHTLPEVPAFARHALETIALEIGNSVVALRTVAALRAEQVRFAQVADTVPGTITTFLLRPDGTLCIPYASRAFADVYGLTLADVAESIAALIARVPADQVERLIAVADESAQTLRPWRQEYQYDHPSKGSIWLEGYSMPVREPDGSTVWYGVTTDITERKQAEEDLRALNQTLEERVAQRTAEVQDLYDHAPVGYHSLDRDGRIVHVNQTALDWLGYTREELLGSLPTVFLAPASYTSFQTAFPRFKEQGRLQGMELELRRKDGSTFPALLSATAMYDATGTVMLSRSTLVDITERKQIEAALRESEQRYRTLVEQMTQGVLIYQDEQVVFGNAAAAQIIGCDGDDLLGRSSEEMAALLHSGEAADLRTWSEDTLLGVSVFSTPFSFSRAADGALRWAISEATATTYNGRPARLVMLSDVTALKLAEEQLRLSEARLHLLMDKTPAVIFSSLAEPDFRSTFISESVRQVLGYEPEQFMASPGFWSSRIHPEDKARVFGDAPQLLAQGWRQYEYRCRHADGSLRWVETGVSLLPAVEDHPAEVVGYMIDITSRKEAEDVLRQANLELARAARLKDEFLANMSHELRTPLNTILGFSENLQAAIYEPLTAGQQGAIKHIETSGRHLLALINDILDLAKVEAGQLTLVCDRFAIADVCQASLLFVKELAHKKALQLSLTLPDPLAMMEADPRRLKQMLINLLANAVKFTPDGGRVRLEVAIDAQAGAVHFAVHDTGIGITPEEQARLFQPFVQLDSSLSRQHEGTGLGLALVRRLAELQGGKVTLESAVGAGSCFTLILPLAPPTPEPPPLAAPTEPGGGPQPSLARTEQPHEPGLGGARILLVEDHEPSIQVTSGYLQARGFVVNVARSGQQALAAAAAQPPDLILIDIQLPELDGLEVMRQLRALPSFARTPIIALTALAMPGDRERCLAAGASAYLTKPVRFRELLETIHRLLQP